MKNVFIVASWKSHKTQAEAQEWIEKLAGQNLQFDNKEVIVCPSFTSLSFLNSYVREHNLNIKIGAQNISEFDEGAYTGEINGRQIAEFGNFVIIGHSERRKNFGEDNEIISRKIDMAFKYGLVPILCVSQTGEARAVKPKLNGKEALIAYEPLFAIGSGNPDSPENAASFAAEVKDILGNSVPVLYGGSVDSKNCNDFTRMESIDGVLVGTASLDAGEFGRIIENG